MKGSEPTTGWTSTRLFAAGVAVAAIASLLIVWTTIVHDDGAGFGYFSVVMAALVGGYASAFRATGMMRTMLGVAMMQFLLGIATATAPVTALLANGPARALAYNAFFALLWLIAAMLFGAADRSSATASRTPL